MFLLLSIKWNISLEYFSTICIFDLIFWISIIFTGRKVKESLMWYIGILMMHDNLLII
jgi:hypothetical protein